MRIRRKLSSNKHGLGLPRAAPLRIRRGRRGLLGRCVTSRAIHNHAGCEIAVIKIGIRFFIRRHDLVDLVAKKASHICDEFRERLRQRLTARHQFAGRSSDALKSRSRSVERGHVCRRHAVGGKCRDIIIREVRDAFGGGFQVVALHCVERGFASLCLRQQIIVAVLHRERRELIGDFQRLVLKIGSRECAT